MASSHDLFRLELVNLIDPRYELVRVAELINWSVFERGFGGRVVSSMGHPTLPARLYLKHTFTLSDEDVVERWIENPYWQHLCGVQYFRHELPCDPSNPMRWRQRIGEAGAKWLVTQAIEAAKASGAVKRSSPATIVLDTTVLQKAIAHLTDSWLLNRAREQLVEAAQGCGIRLRQSYARVGPAAEHRVGRYAHTRQYRRMQGQLRKLLTWLGRVIRDVERKAHGEIPKALADKLDVARRLHAQRRDSKNKLYALHAPEVECAYRTQNRTLRRCSARRVATCSRLTCELTTFGG